MNPASPPNVLLWDSDGILPSTNDYVVLWNSFSVTGSVHPAVSIPEYVEEHSERLRSRFLGFVHDVGNSHSGAKTVLEHLQIRPTGLFVMCSSHKTSRALQHAPSSARARCGPGSRPRGRATSPTRASWRSPRVKSTRSSTFSTHGHATCWFATRRTGSRPGLPRAGCWRLPSSRART